MKINLFKEELQRKCDILSWCPTISRLIKIASEIKRRANNVEDLTKSDIQGIVSEYVEDVNFDLLEGVDNSDLNTLLILAKRIDSSQK